MTLDDATLARMGLSRETDIALDAEGNWSTGGAPIVHPGVKEALSRWLIRAPDGRYALENPIHWVYVRVDGAPLHAREVLAKEERPVLVLQSGEEEPLRAETLREGPDGALYASGRDGTWPVRLSAQAALDLAPWLVERDGRAALSVGGTVHAIPVAGDPLGYAPEA